MGKLEIGNWKYEWPYDNNWLEQFPQAVRQGCWNLIVILWKWQALHPRKRASISSDGRCDIQSLIHNPTIGELWRKWKSYTMGNTEWKPLDWQALNAACLCYFQPSQPEYCQTETFPAYRLQNRRVYLGAERATWYVAMVDQFDSMAITFRVMSHPWAFAMITCGHERRTLSFEKGVSKLCLTNVHWRQSSPEDS
jgi:hypothetical protein